MSAYLIGYIVVCALLFLVVNRLFRPKNDAAAAKKAAGTEAKATPSERVKPEAVRAETTPAEPVAKEPILTEPTHQEPVIHETAAPVQSYADIKLQDLPPRSARFTETSEKQAEQPAENKAPEAEEATKADAEPVADADAEKLPETAVTQSDYTPVAQPTEAFAEELKETFDLAVPEPKTPQVPEKKEEKPEANRPGGELKIGQILTVLLLGAFIAILNQTLINVALPTMMNDFGVSANTIQWLVTGYMLVNGVMIPITAFLIQTFGTRKLFIAAMFLFTVGAVICAFSPSYSIMLFGRLVQAAGAGIIMPLMMTVFLTVFPPEKRGSAMGMMGIAMIFAPAVGPTLSGWIVENYSWRILFYIVIPFGVIDLILAFAWLRDVTKRVKSKFDYLGFVFSTAGFGGLLYAFSEAGSKGWGDPTVDTWLIIGIIALALFVWRELTTDAPMLDLRVFKYNIFTLTTIISAVINMAMFAAMVLLPVYLQNIRGFTPLQSGLLLLPGAIIMGIMSPISGALFDRIGARILAVFGLIITVITSYTFTLLDENTTYGTIMVMYCFRMFGMSFLMMTVMTAGMNQLPRRLTSHGTAANNTARQVAGSLGTALLVSVMSNRAAFHYGNYQAVVTSSNVYQSNSVDYLSAGLAHMMGLPAQAGHPITTYLLYGLAQKESTIQGINDAFWWATAFSVLALVLSFFIKRVKPNLE